LQIKPGYSCTILLAGHLAVTGFINARQAAADKDHHAVLLQGRSRSQDMVDGSIASSTGGEFKNKTWLQIAQQVLQGYNTDVTVGPTAVNAGFPYPSVQVQTGESPFDLLDRIGRKRGLTMTEDATGKLTADGTMSGAPQGRLVEGQNIKSMQVTIRDDNLPNAILGLGQNLGTDDVNGNAAAMIAAQTTFPGVTRFRPQHFLAESPLSQKEMQMRVDYEAQWLEYTTVEAIFTVYGWLDGGTTGDLWSPGAFVPVYAPMGMVDGVLGLKSVTFTQDSAGGTQSTLELVRTKNLTNNLAFTQDAPPATPITPPQDGQ